MTSPAGPVLFAYDGSELAAHAIKQAGAQLAVGRAAVVVCVWQPADVGFEPINGRHFDADKAPEVHKAAEETAAYGASLARAAGFEATSVTIEDAPTWKGIVKTAEDAGAGLIVLGTHRHTGIIGHLGGSVASAVIAHSTSPVMVVHLPVN
jgi:nucleotide-binding universal stress UspA family protein